MPTYLSPGVYMEEVSSGSKPIEGVGTAVAAFVGFAERGPANQPTLAETSTSAGRKARPTIPAAAPRHPEWMFAITAPAAAANVTSPVNVAYTVGGSTTIPSGS